MVVSLGFSMCNILSANSESFTFSFPIWIPFISISSLIPMSRASKTMLNNSGESGHPCLVPDLRGNAFSFSHWENVSCGFIIYGLYNVELPGDASGKEPACQCRGCKRCGFNPWIRNIPWSGAQQPTPVFLPEECHGRTSQSGNSPQGHTQSDSAEVTERSTHRCLLCPFSEECFFFNHKWGLNFVESFFCINWECHMTFIF